MFSLLCLSFIVGVHNQNDKNLAVILVFRSDELREIGPMSWAVGLEGYREIMHSMWKPAKFKFVYLFATLYVLTLTLPSGITLYWAFGDTLLTHSNSISLLPKTVARDIAIILMLIHQVQPPSCTNCNLHIIHIVGTSFPCSTHATTYSISTAPSRSSSQWVSLWRPCSSCGKSSWASTTRRAIPSESFVACPSSYPFGSLPSLSHSSARSTPQWEHCSSPSPSTSFLALPTWCTSAQLQLAWYHYFCH